MPDSYNRRRLLEMNPLPRRVLPADNDPMPESPERIARQGYQTVNRADPRDWNPNMRGLAPPVYDGPNIDDQG